MALGFTMKISKGAYQKALKKVQAANRVFRRHKGGVPSEKLKGKGTNRDRAVVEFYRFQTRKTAKPFVGYLKGGKVTNFTGLRLCTITSRKEGRRGFGGSRLASVTARCVDGRQYVGTGSGDGMSIQMRPKKGKGLGNVEFPASRRFKIKLSGLRSRRRR